MLQRMVLGRGETDEVAHWHGQICRTLHGEQAREAVVLEIASVDSLAMRVVDIDVIVAKIDLFGSP